MQLGRVDEFKVKERPAAKSDGTIDKRNRAVVAFALLSGARVGAVASLQIKHVDMAAQTVLQDGRDVRTKGRKTFTSCFFPVGPEPLAIFADYLEVLKELGFSPDDPLFPSVQIGLRANAAEIEFVPQVAG